MIRDRILAILAAQALISPDALRLEAAPQELGLDSLALVEAIFALEEEFDISIPFNAQDPEASSFDMSTLGGLVIEVEALVAASATAG